ncbi:helix-turn-helix domain-containing protein [Algirhabdus cladophorae]|uniref:helix-turn-helix domain-containing protein n=1 Tax=Algirhabdus cladophorae TaxID=3377108 RepID=UPI003B845956
MTKAAHGTLVSTISSTNPSFAWRHEMLHSAPQDRYFWVTRGQARAIVAGAEVGLSQNSLVSVPAKVPFQLQTSAGTFLNILATDQLARRVGEPKSQLYRLSDPSAQRDMAQLFETLRRETQTVEIGQNRAIQANVLLLTVWLLRHDRLLFSPQRLSAAQRLSRAFLSMLEAGFASDKSPQHYAAALGVTPTHLTRATKEALNKPASTLVADRKYRAAKEAIIDHGTPIKDVAAALGFSSAAYFTRGFQTHCGQTPSGFKKAQNTVLTPSTT